MLICFRKTSQATVHWEPIYHPWVLWPLSWGKSLGVGVLAALCPQPLLSPWAQSPPSQSQTSSSGRAGEDVNFLKPPCRLRSSRSSLVTQQAKDLALSLLWHGFDPWPGKFCMPWAWSKKKKNSSAHTWHLPKNKHQLNLPLNMWWLLDTSKTARKRLGNIGTYWY